MPYNEGARASGLPGEQVVAHAQINHGQLAADGGYVGQAIKQATPAADGLRANRNVIAASEAYLLVLHGKVEAPLLSGATQGALVYIIVATNVLTLTASGNQVVGRVSDLPGIRGCPAGVMRVNLDEKL